MVRHVQQAIPKRLDPHIHPLRAACRRAAKTAILAPKEMRAPLPSPGQMKAACQYGSDRRRLNPQLRNHVEVPSHSSSIYMGSFVSEPIELQPANGTLGTTIVSGVFRWLSKDPLSELGVDAISQSRASPCPSCRLPSTSLDVPSLQPYAFCANSPLNSVDPLGLWNLWSFPTWGFPTELAGTFGTR